MFSSSVDFFTNKYLITQYEPKTLGREVPQLFPVSKQITQHLFNWVANQRMGWARSFPTSNRKWTGKSAFLLLRGNRGQTRFVGCAQVFFWNFVFVFFSWSEFMIERELFENHVSFRVQIALSPFAKFRKLRRTVTIRDISKIEASNYCSFSNKPSLLMNPNQTPQPLGKNTQTAVPGTCPPVAVRPGRSPWLWSSPHLPSLWCVFFNCFLPRCLFDRWPGLGSRLCLDLVARVCRGTLFVPAQMGTQIRCTKLKKSFFNFLYKKYLVFWQSRSFTLNVRSLTDQLPGIFPFYSVGVTLAPGRRRVIRNTHTLISSLSNTIFYNFFQRIHLIQCMIPQKKCKCVFPVSSF